MNLIKPKKLQKGDKIGLLSVSGDIREPERIQKATKYLEEKGFEVVVSETTYKKDRYFAGSDKERLDALHNFFNDKGIDAIVATRGGYGIIRILDQIDFELIKSNPKILVGYSDITALLTAILKKTGIVTFHGAMTNGDFGVDEVNLFTEKSFFDVLGNTVSSYFYTAQEGFKTYFSGTAQGMLWGGNLATLASLAGQDFVPDEKFILFLEDLNEPVYKIDRMITQLLRLDGFKENLAGVVFGKFSRVDNEFYLKELFEELASKLQVPMVDNFQISHDKDKYTLPVGVKCELDSKKGEIIILENPFSL